MLQIIADLLIYLAALIRHNEPIDSAKGEDISQISGFMFIADSEHVKMTL